MIRLLYAFVWVRFNHWNKHTQHWIEMRNSMFVDCIVRRFVLLLLLISYKSMGRKLLFAHHTPIARREELKRELVETKTIKMQIGFIFPGMHIESYQSLYLCQRVRTTYNQSRIVFIIIVKITISLSIGYRSQSHFCTYV